MDAVVENKEVSEWQRARRVHRSRESKIDYEMMRKLCIDIQMDAFSKARRINEYLKRVYRDCELPVIGHSHRAAGVIFYKYENNDPKILLGLFKRKDNIAYKILGGSAIDEETPLATMIREFQEETLDLIPDESVEKMKSRAHLTFNVSKGKYTVYIIPYGEYLATIDIATEYEKRLKEVTEGKREVRGGGRPPLKLEWKSLNEPLKCEDFTLEILKSVELNESLQVSHNEE